MKLAENHAKYNHPWPVTFSAGMILQESGLITGDVILKRYMVTILFMAVIAVLLIAGPVSGNEVRAIAVSSAGSDMIFVPVPIPAPGSDITGNFTRLEIIPSYSQFMLKPGESKDMTVTVRNRDSRMVSLRPEVKSQPYGGPYILESSWMSITPATAEVEAGGNAKFTIKASVPADAIRGSYNAMVVFTDEQYPSPYPAPFPNYIHVMNLGVNIVSPPVITISTPYVSDQVEAGKQYQYSVEIQNTGNSAVQLNPRITGDGYPMYSPSGIQEPALTENDFSLNAPSAIQPGVKGTVNVILNVPVTSRGYYNGYIDLGIDDPSIREGEGRIMLNFNIWRQPPEPFIKKFTMDTADPISIELSSVFSSMGPVPAGIMTNMVPNREPGFDTLLTGPGGTIATRSVQKVIKGTVNLGGDSLGIASQQAGTYLETNTQYIVTYSAEGTPGNWQLSVMPKNAQAFEYKITLGGPDAPVASVNTTPTSEIVTVPVLPVQNTSVSVQGPK